MTTRYRLYTELKNEPLLLNLFDKYFDEGYTVSHTIGRWQGKAEPSIVFEVIGERYLLTLRVIADKIKTVNEQQCVLITSEDIKSEFR